MNKKEFKKLLKKTWHFIWEDNSIWSWIVNIILAFVLIKFIVYPGLGYILSSSHPVVAVVSSSMEHNMNFEAWWQENKDWYMKNGINKEDFETFSLKNGFDKGDIMILVGIGTEDITVGDVIVFRSSRDNPRSDPIIHRVVNKNKTKIFILMTKGDNNPNPINGCTGNSCLYENDIREEQIIGKAVIRVPLLGYIKILFVDYIATPYCSISNNFFPCRS